MLIRKYVKTVHTGLSFRHIKHFGWVVDPWTTNPVFSALYLYTCESVNTVMCTIHLF